MISTAAFNRAYGRSGHRIWVAYRTEHVVIRPANHGHAWVAFAKEHCTAMVFAGIQPDAAAWFSEMWDTWSVVLGTS